MPNYTKLFNSIITSTIWTEDDKTRIMWITMLAMSDKNGEVHASIPGLARVSGMTIEDAEKSINRLLSPDAYSRTPDNEGRRIAVISGGWELLNHAKYRLMASKEDEKAANAERVRRHRARNGHVTVCNGSVMVGNGVLTVGRDIAEAEADTKADKVKNNPNPPNKEDDEDVFQFWNSFPQLPKVMRISKERKAKMRTRLKDAFFRDNWRQGIEIIPTRPFLIGQNDRGWKADIEWFMQPDSLTKIIEGKYAQTPNGKPAKSTISDLMGGRKLNITTCDPNEKHEPEQTNDDPCPF